MNADSSDAGGRPSSTTSRRRAGGAPVRIYVVLAQFRFETGVEYYVELRRVEATNATNALRKAFAAAQSDPTTAAEAVLVAVPQASWRPREVRVRPRNPVEVTVADYDDVADYDGE